ncbi:thioredoxin domain-containing protein [Alteromonas genovensis]|jgi:predicted DsbA family dithiol-disulfide isomerase|uniref:Thioredoxin domain-containing protein n=1 Tax=Alteromonas genovensis TaxID=471225 RepID=A0A6N9TLX6_9ALTE|nr:MULTISPECIES: DsbA family oxidoreductase [Alteromonas]MAI39375.1 disulfide bond formation protein DsbA [Alteromonas sp.]NDW16529.1 thioredoxin domain-containing protein [Alteromonas genovensis]OUX84258.1 MAG: disulfide bond formation protein DsbA [Alteromonas sp. TMED35]
MQTVTIDMVSDVVCPWCIVGYKRLQQAIQQLDNISVEVKFHPFELNPAMPEEGQNLREHVIEKYGITPAQSSENRQRLIDVGKTIGFDFNLADDATMQNTFKAHQLIHYADEMGLAVPMKMRLFEAYFTEGKDINNTDILIQEGSSIGLDVQTIKDVLADERYSDAVRQLESAWMQRGIQSVPTFVIGNQGVAGAQDPETLAAFIKEAAGASQ